MKKMKKHLCTGDALKKKKQNRKLKKLDALETTWDRWVYLQFDNYVLHLFESSKCTKTPQTLTTKLHRIIYKRESPQSGSMVDIKGDKVPFKVQKLNQAFYKLCFFVRAHAKQFELAEISGNFKILKVKI